MSRAWICAASMEGDAMIDAIAGDIIGSVYEFEGIKTTGFPLFGPRPPHRFCPGWLKP